MTIQDRFRRSAPRAAARLTETDRPQLGLALLAVTIAGGIVASASLGVRQSFGLLLTPALAQGTAVVAAWTFAIALHNLVWGIAQPLAGAAADRHGALVVTVIGCLCYAGGLALVAAIPSRETLVLGLGIGVGVGLACTSFGTVFAAIGRVASAEQHAKALGIASAITALGQILVPPLVAHFIEANSVAVALTFLATLIALAMPCALPLRKAAAPSAPVQPPDRQRPVPFACVLRAAAGDAGFRLLTVGFFACGFQLAFIGTHLPGYLALERIGADVAATALGLIGLFNVAGSWAWGALGSRWRPQNALGLLYLLRALLIAAFLVLPKSAGSVFVFASSMGLMWLSAVPLTASVISRRFGTAHLGLLFGIAFFSHQVGSFVGAWLGGWSIAATGSYLSVWLLAIASGITAAALHALIKDGPHWNGGRVVAPASDR